MDDIYGSETKIDVLMLFRKKPALTYSPEEISDKVEQKQEQVERALKDFIKIGLVQEKKSGKTRTISFNRDKDEEIKKKIAEHIQRQRENMFVKLFLSGTSKGRSNI
jgi:DNA-binding MarR family transcriptional regulator